MLRKLMVAALAALVAGCAGDGAPGGPPMPELTAELAVRVGSVDDPEYTLTWFRSMAVGPDGTMYTVHPMDQVIRVFTPDGVAAGRIGGRGQGPGEFQNVFNVGWVADTLWVLDGNGYRFSQFTPEGVLLGTFSVPFTMTEDPREVQPPRANGLLFDGTVHGSPPAFSNQVANGIITHHVPLLMARDGSVLDTLPSIAFGNNQWAVTNPDAPDRGGMYMQQPWGDGPLWSFGANERAVIVLTRTAPTDSAASAFTVTKLSFDGDTLFHRRFPAPTRPVTGAMVDSVLDAFQTRLGERSFMGQSGTGLRTWAANSLYRPAFQPPATAMVAGRDGTVWVCLGPDGAGHDTWWVLSSEGEPMGSVTFPMGTTILVAERHQVWGSITDDLDVPYLVSYRVS